MKMGKSRDPNSVFRTPLPFRCRGAALVEQRVKIGDCPVLTACERRWSWTQ